MGSINPGIKAKRLASGRRYGSLSINTVDAQEPSTSTLDININEIYTQTNLIPTASSPFSGSSQNGYYLLSNGTLNDGSSGQPADAVLRYWYRHQLTETAGDLQDVYFFIDPPGQTEGVLADPQVILNNHQTNFISNKYLTGSQAFTDFAQSTTPQAGYKVVVEYRRQNLGQNWTILNANFYEFDYKTGVLQVNSPLAVSVTPQGGQAWPASDVDLGSTPGASNNLEVVITAVQYVGKTLNTRLSEMDSAIAQGGGGGGGSFISSSNGQTMVSASNDGVSIKVGNVALGGFSSNSASFSVPISSSFTGVGFVGTASFATTALSASVTTVTNDANYYVSIHPQSTGNTAFNTDTDLTYNPSTNVLTTTASYASFAGTASFALTASNITNAFTNAIAPVANHVVVSKGQGQVSGSGNFAFDSATNVLTIGNSGADVTISPTTFDVAGNTYTFAFGNVANAIQITNAGNSNNALVTFNLSASFTAPTTFANAQSTTFDDQFILLASGSSQLNQGHKDSGIVFEYGSAIGSGSALFFDGASSKRLAFRYSASVSDLAMTPQAYINMTFVPNAGQGISNTSDVDSKFVAAGGANDDTMKGFMFVDSDGNIYIKA